ncbi:hypothetical protein [Roseibium sp.]|uniref:hypothetical protein n=1 Tax=Roseibium sp. TaxID=1936156 RepID=UPI003B51E2D5
MNIVLKDNWPETDPYGISQADHPEEAIAIQTGVFGQGLQVWSMCQPKNASTIFAAALAFNCTPDQIRHAVEQHPYLFVCGDKIEHDGE